MKELIKVNDHLTIEKDKRMRRTIISIIENDKKKILCDMNTDDFFKCGVIFDNNYIVVYSRGCMVNQIPLNVEAAYDINEKRLVDLSEQKIKIILEYMFISTRGFDLANILSFINSEDLGILDDDEKDDVKRILTSGNEKISDKEVINYILSKYPILAKYRNLSGPLTVKEYRKIEEQTGKNIFRFHLMPQSISFLEKDNSSPTLSLLDSQEASESEEVYTSAFTKVKRLRDSYLSKTRNIYGRKN